MNFVELTVTLQPRGEPILAPYAVTRETFEAAEELKRLGYHFEMNEGKTGDFQLAVVAVGEEGPVLVASTVEGAHVNMAEAVARLVNAASKEITGGSR